MLLPENRVFGIPDLLISETVVIYPLVFSYPTVMDTNYNNSVLSPAKKISFNKGQIRIWDNKEIS